MSESTDTVGWISPTIEPTRPHRPRLEAFERTHPLVMAACGFLALSALAAGCMFFVVFGIGLVYIAGKAVLFQVGPDEGPDFVVMGAIYFLLSLGLIRLSWKALMILDGVNSVGAAKPVAPIKATASPASGLWDRDLDEPF